jgi:hypothetical protein
VAIFNLQRAVPADTLGAALEITLKLPVMQVQLSAGSSTFGWAYPDLLSPQGANHSAKNASGQPMVAAASMRVVRAWLLLARSMAVVALKTQLVAALWWILTRMIDTEYWMLWMAVSGWLTWTWLEYALHRWLIGSAWFSRRYPGLALRLAAGLVFGRMRRMGVLAGMLALVWTSLHVWPEAMWLAGMASGWLWYSYIREMICWSGCGKWLPIVYSKHQYRLSGAANAGFGWSVSFWDRLYSTLPPARPKLRSGVCLRY